LNRVARLAVRRDPVRSARDRIVAGGVALVLQNVNRSKARRSKVRATRMLGMSGHQGQTTDEFHGEPLRGTPSREPDTALTEDEWGTGPIGEAPHPVEPDDDIRVDEFGKPSQKRSSRLGLLVVGALIVAALVGYTVAR
jgi:hypothetical protein